MLRIEYTQYGGPEHMRLADVALSKPSRQEIMVRVKAASVNPIDWKMRSGDLKLLTGATFPRGMGRDFAGIVEAVGPNVTRFRVGDDVFGGMELKQAASFAEALITPEGTATLKPPSLTFEQAATLATVGKTAWGALVNVGHIHPGQRLFVNGCMGGVGRCAIQIGRMFGAQVSGTCGGADMAEAKALGLDEVIDYRNFAPERFRASFDLVLDTFGNLAPSQCAIMMRRGGVAMHVTGSFGKILRILLIPRNKFVGAKTTPELLAKLGEAAAYGELTLPIGRTVPLNNAIPTIAALEQTGQPKGKLVITPA